MKKKKPKAEESEGNQKSYEGIGAWREYATTRVTRGMASRIMAAQQTSASAKNNESKITWRNKQNQRWRKRAAGVSMFVWHQYAPARGIMPLAHVHRSNAGVYSSAS